MADLSRELLERPPEETSRFLALLLLDEAESAIKRMKDPEDSEALHDFRVGLRRLRSSIRAYQAYLESSISKKMRKQIKALAGSTNQARDTEVQIAWLKPQTDGLSPRHQVGARWLIENLESRQTEPQTTSLETLTRGFTKLRGKLSQRLSVCEIRLDTRQQGARPSFLTITGGLISQHSSALARELATVRSVADVEPIHRSRICVKRLRYLLEPLRKEIAGVKQLVKDLKSIQDVLGDLHDAKLLEIEIASALERSAIEQAHRLQEIALEAVSDPATPRSTDWEERYGMLELLRILKDRADKLFARTEVEYLGENGSGFFRRVEDLGRKLGSFPDGRKARRRYVLKAVPERAKADPGILIEEGWLPGKNIPEIVRKVRQGRRVTYFRILLPEGQPGAVEERISKKLFDALWPLTERRRLRRRRHEVIEGHLKWHISVVADRDLVLAEIDLTPEESDFSPTAWILEYIESDVTGRKRYESTALASSQAKPGPMKTSTAQSTAGS